MEERLAKFVEQTGGNMKMFYYTCRIEHRGKVSELTCNELMKIHSNFPELNIDWLITGRGQMIFLTCDQ